MRTWCWRASEGGRSALIKRDAPQRSLAAWTAHHVPDMLASILSLLVRLGKPFFDHRPREGVPKK
jgi:hypothetical protein